MKSLKLIVGSCLFAAALGLTAARAEITKPVKIMILNDQSSVFSEASGAGGAVAAQLAIEDAGGKVGGFPVELVSADHQNKPDLAATLARKAFDVDGVDAIFDVANSAASLAVQQIGRERGKIVVHVGSAHADLYGKACSATGALWLYDTYSLAQGLSRAIVANGGDSWFFITADYAFGHAMQAEVEKVVRSLGAKVVGAVRHPVGNMDFSSFLLQAQSSGAKVVALANASGDTVTTLKQAREFGVGQGGQKLAVLIFYLTSVHALGAEATQGVQYLTGYYWDQNDASRAFGKRFAARYRDRMPTQAQAGDYSAVLHYLRAVEAAKTTDGLTVMRKMKATPVDDFFAPGAYVREDGRLQNDSFLAEVKPPAEVKQGWDLLTIKGKVKAADILRPVADGGCPYLDGGQGK